VSRALINAKRACWDEKGGYINCEHLDWKGGIQVLISKNEILADSLHNLPDNINWYSLKTNQADLDTSIWFTIKEKMEYLFIYRLSKRVQTLVRDEIFVRSKNPTIRRI
jgi:hypothetical protein